MEVLYNSTRNNKIQVKASEAILKGLSDDGGLFVPDHIPALPKSLKELSGMTYQEVAYEIMSLYLTDFTEEELKSVLQTPMIPNSIRRRLRLWCRRTAPISWNCSTAQPLHLKIWLYPFYLI